jgi:hypothetical protein
MENGSKVDIIGTRGSRAVSLKKTDAYSLTCLIGANNAEVLVMLWVDFQSPILMLGVEAS